MNLTNTMPGRPANDIMEDKDISLLRPFDLEAAKAGVPLTGTGDPTWEYVAGPDADGNLIATVIATGKFTQKFSPESVRMAPLCWVEGKPVYKGDVLYWIDHNDGGIAKPHIADRFERIGSTNVLWQETGTDENKGYVRLKNLAWTQHRKPLCEVEGKPVYEGDTIYGPSGEATATKHGADYGDGGVVQWSYFTPGLWRLSKHPDFKQSDKRPLTLLAFIDDQGTLRWIREDLFKDAGFLRVPTEDKVIEVTA